MGIEILYQMKLYIYRQRSKVQRVGAILFGDARNLRTNEIKSVKVHGNYCLVQKPFGKSIGTCKTSNFTCSRSQVLPSS